MEWWQCLNTAVQQDLFYSVKWKQRNCSAAWFSSYGNFLLSNEI